MAAIVAHVIPHMDSRRLALPLTLQPISPALSAIHVNRVRRNLRSGAEEEEKEVDDLADTHCLGCGRFQLDGSADTRLVRDNKPRPSVVILQKTCRSCGFTRRSPLVKGGAAAFQSHWKRNRRDPNPKPPGTQMEMERETQSVVRTQSPPIPSVMQPGQKPTPSTSDEQKRSKNRKARPGLREMLERKRKQDQVQSTGTSLASFLQGL